MDYFKIYDRIIDRARGRVLSGYSERHHVVPKCMGGTDDPENIVVLTAEEHFVAHELLVRMHPSNRGLAFAMLALGMNVGNRRPTNKLFGWHRRLVAKAVGDSKRGVPRDKEMMERIWASSRGRIAPSHEREKIRAALRGKPKSQAHREAMSAALKGRKSPMEGRKHSEETKQKMREKATGRKMLPQDIAKMVANKTPEQRRAGALKAWETKRAKKSERSPE